MHNLKIIKERYSNGHFFKVRIFDRHVKEKMDIDGNFIYEFEDGWEYKRFWYSFDLSLFRIVDYKDVVLFDELWNPIRATRVTISNDYFFMLLVPLKHLNLLFLRSTMLWCKT